MHRMPRSLHRVTDSPEATALDEASHAFDQAEQAYENARRHLIAAMVTADAAGISKAEIGRRTGYTREHASKLITEALRRSEADAGVDAVIRDEDGKISGVYQVKRSVLGSLKNAPRSPRSKRSDSTRQD